jgi:hypothetical protein
LSGAKPPQRLAMIAVIQEFVNGNLAKIKNENLTNLLHTQLEEIIKSDGLYILTF